VRLALRRARQASGLNQNDVADRLGWSRSKVQRIESGEVAVSPIDLRALAEVYGNFPAEELTELVEDARLSRRERWQTLPEHREHLTPSTIKLMGFEAQAVAIHVYQPVMLPGVLQTTEVARETLRFFDPDASEERNRVRLDARRSRREQIIERAQPPDYHLVLDESVLLRNVGGKALAAAQMEALQRDTELPNVHVRVLPLAKGALHGGRGPFAILDMDPHDPDDAVLYREDWKGDEIIDDQNVVRRHREYYRTMWKETLIEQASHRRIVAEAASLRSSLDRRET
jgi:transcriptional regulator with XRE-family HTH domain